MEQKSHTNYDHFTRYSLEELPSFAVLIFKEKMIPDEEKFKFSNLFLEPYMTDQSFRDSVQELDIFFCYWKLWPNLGRDRREAKIPKEIPGTRVLCFLVSDNPEKIYFLPIKNQVQINIDNYDCPKLARTSINFYPNPETCFTEERLIDSGASYTTIPCINNWDYDTGVEYKNETLGSGRYSFNCSSFNRNIESVKNLNVDTANGIIEYKKVTWENPLLLSIGELQPVQIKVMIVPVNKVENLNVIGFDVITKHTMIISSTDGKVDIKFFASERSENIGIELFSSARAIKRSWFKKLDGEIIESSEL